MATLDKKLKPHLTQVLIQKSEEIMSQETKDQLEDMRELLRELETKKTLMRSTLIELEKSYYQLKSTSSRNRHT